MRRTWTVSLFRQEQPDEAAWRRLRELVGAWNAGAGPSWEPVMDFMWHVGFDEATRPRMDALLAELDALERTAGARYSLAWRDTPEKEDFARADFVEITGGELEDLSRPFVANAREALGPSAPCPVCGWHDGTDAVQRAPFVINPRRLARAVTEPPPEGGEWGVVDLPNGSNLVSRRVVDLLREHDVRGYELREVTDGDTRAPSAEWFQLLARRAVLVPCPVHTPGAEAAFCPACGSASGEVEGEVCLRRDWLEGDEIVSRHRGRGARLCLGRRVLELLREAGVAGVNPREALRVCDHGEQGAG